MIGIDLVLLSRIRLSESFINTVLTEQEREEYNRRSSEKRRKEYLAGRFAAKEAIFKASQEKDYLKLSVLSDEDGRPYVKGHPDLDVSISHDGDYVVAVALKKQ